MTSFTKGPRISREMLDASRAAWDAGGFSDEWRPWRRMAAIEAGILFPPDGTAHDSWDDDAPSQRAILIRAIRETPQLLRRSIEAPGVRTWGDVIGRLLGGRDRMRDELDRAGELEADRRSGEPTRAEAAEALRSILGGITR